MKQVSTIGMVLAKRSFQLHGGRADGAVAFQETVRHEKLLDFLTSQPRCTVAVSLYSSARLPLT